MCSKQWTVDVKTVTELLAPEVWYPSYTLHAEYVHDYRKNNCIYMLERSR